MRGRLYQQPLFIGGKTVPPFTKGSRNIQGRWLIPYKDPITDAEKFCAFHLDRQWGLMSHWEREDEYTEALNILIHHLWRLEVKFDPERNDSFGNYARTYIRRRAVDVGPRRILGRNGRRLADYLHDELDEEAGTGFGGLDPDGEGDPDQDRGGLGGGVLRLRDSREAWSDILMGVGATGVAA